MTGRRHVSTYARLIANTAEPESHTACWHWIGTTRRHGGGVRPAVSLRMPGVKHPRQQNAARVMIEQFGPLAEEHNASHLCADNWLCINPDHLIAETFRANILRRDGVDVALPVSEQVDDDPDWRAGVPADECPF